MPCRSTSPLAYTPSGWGRPVMNGPQTPPTVAHGRLGTEPQHQGPLGAGRDQAGPCFSEVACLTFGSPAVPDTGVDSLRSRAVDSGCSTARSLSTGGRVPASPWGGQEQASLELRAQRRRQGRGGRGRGTIAALRGREKDLAFAPKDVGNHWKLLRNGVIRCTFLKDPLSALRTDLWREQNPPAGPGGGTQRQHYPWEVVLTRFADQPARGCTRKERR